MEDLKKLTNNKIVAILLFLVLIFVVFNFYAPIFKHIYETGLDFGRNIYKAFF